MLARENDGEGILKIMEEDAVKGDIKLLYTRRPNPYTSLMKESSRSVIGVFKKAEEVVGTIACIPRKMYINSEIRTVSYVTNMKRSHGYDGLINWIEAFNKMYDPVDSEVFFCSVVIENTDVIKMLTKRRKKLPFSVKIDGYRTYIISPTAHIKDPCPGLCFKRAEEKDAEEILKFLKENGNGKNFFPVFESFDEDNLPDVTDFFILYDKNGIKAVGALWDRSDCKQYIVESYSRKIAFLRRFNFLLSLLGYIKIPKAGNRADFAFLSFFLAEGERADLYRTFLYHIRKEMAGKYDMFVLGTSKHNKKRAVLDSIRAITFDTQLCEVRMSDFRNVSDIEFDHEQLEVECALL